MLTRFIRIQLAIFGIVSVLGLVVMTVNYVQAPTLLGIGRITVTMELPRAGGLYRFANVTYRGIQVGRVTAVEVHRDGATATLTLNTSPQVPSDLQADVRSVSAVGEQYVDLRPRTQSGPFLHERSVIAADDVTVPQQVAPMLDRLDGLVASIPTDRLADLLDHSFEAFNGAGSDLRSLVDSSARITRDLNAAGDQTARLVDDATPLLNAQLQSADALRSWSADLSGVTQQLVANDPQLRTVLQSTPGAAATVSGLLEQLNLTLPVLLANLSTLGQVGVTYNPALRQVLVLLPPLVSYYQSSAGGQNSTGLPIGDFRVSVGDPPGCTVGFLPPSSWRNPAETDTIDTPDGLYCKLPQDSPIAVRGARNYPCMGVPGKRAPTVQECNGDQAFMPLAMRQHALGPYPLDPNLIAQGIQPDDRVSVNDNIFGPVEGTSLPPGTTVPPPDSPSNAPADDSPLPDGGGGDVPPSPPAGQPVPPPIDSATPVAPSGFQRADGSSGPVAFARYDPETGRYATPDGVVGEQTDLVAPIGAGDWKRLLMPVGPDSKAPK